MCHKDNWLSVLKETITIISTRSSVDTATQVTLPGIGSNRQFPLGPLGCLGPGLRLIEEFCDVVPYIVAQTAK
jgi:hypothetical protein